MDACAECGNDDPTEGYPLCMDCIEAGHLDDHTTADPTG